MTVAFADLHVPGHPLILPNAWDHASAALLAQRYAAVGTTSLGVAAAYGLPDGVGAIDAQTLDLARRIVHLPCHITVDIEQGSVPLAIELAGLGIAGINVEDGGGPVEPLCARIAEIKSAVPSLFVNARTDTYWLGIDHGSTIDRLLAFVEAGADGVFVPGPVPAAMIETIVAEVPRPLNILYSPEGPTMGELAALGVARVSTGSALYRAALQAALALVAKISDSQAPEVLDYARIQSLAEGENMAE
jgi:2-methylisocitrate lyase-like PEP mutase family enzyme